jgi:hypothetical protein
MQAFSPNFNWEDFSNEEGKCMQYNAQAIGLLTKALEYGFHV